MIAAASGGMLGGFVVDMKNHLSPFFAAIGELVVSWNIAEGVLKTILVALCGENPKTWILTAELGNVALENAVRSASAALAPDKLKMHIDHAVEWFSRLREQRNYLVHGIQSVRLEKGDPVGIISRVSAKKSLTLHQEYLTTIRIDDLTKQIR